MHDKIDVKRIVFLVATTKAENIESTDGDQKSKKI